MTFRIQGKEAGTVLGSGVDASSPIHVSPRPLGVSGALGHYRTPVKFAQGNGAQAAPIWALRNNGSNLLVVTKASVKIIQTVNFTTAGEYQWGWSTLFNSTDPGTGGTAPSSQASRAGFVHA
jgi:hypothetical protein